MKRILIISTFFPPLNSSASLRPYSWAKTWSQAENDITILTTTKQQDPSLDLILPIKNFKTIEVDIPASLFRIIPFFEKLRKKRGILQNCRMPDLTDFWIKPAYHAIRDEKPWDIVISTSGPYTTHRLAKKLKKKGLTKKWIADFREPWYGHHHYPGLFPFTLVEKILEKKLVKQADLVTTTSPSLTNHFKKKYKPPSIYTIENGCDPEDIEKLPPVPIFLNDQTTRIVYTGSFNPKTQDIEPLFRAIKELNPKSLEVIFVGPDLKALDELISSHEVGHWVKNLGFVNREIALRMQRDATALLYLPQNSNGKLLEYIYSKTPILAIGGKENPIIKDTGSGKHLENVEEIKEAINNLKPQKNTINKEVFSRYTSELQAKKLLDIINESCHPV